MSIRFLLLLISIFATAVGAQSTAFKFRAERVPVGTVFHYMKTNEDGTQPENVSTYIAKADRIESFKYHEKGTPAGLVIAEMDRTNFMARKLESWQVFSADDRRLFATLSYDDVKQTIIVSIPAMKPEPETVKIGRLPFHLYNFDLTSLNFSMPHLRKPTKQFTVGIADPTFKADGPLVGYRGDLTVTYEKEEMRNDVKCRRYSASGVGIGGKGTIWVDKKGGFIQDMEFDVPNNPDWKTFKLKLIKTDKMSHQEWQKFITSHFLK